MRPFAVMTKERQIKKPGTKTVWQTTDTETRTIDEATHTRIVNAAPLMRRLGGSEYLDRCYTYRGYKVWKIISTRPDKQVRSVYRFDFDAAAKLPETED